MKRGATISTIRRGGKAEIAVLSPAAAIHYDAPMSSSTRREVFYSGHVQGVGFRYTARSIAEGFDVAGYVENLPDGRVHLEVEGSADAVCDFLAAVSDEMHGNIRSQHVTELPATGEFTSFAIRR